MNISNGASSSLENTSDDFATVFVGEKQFRLFSNLLNIQLEGFIRVVQDHQAGLLFTLPQESQEILRALLKGDIFSFDKGRSRITENSMVL